eukprot:1885288-Rhodomonas_salina.1
MLPKHNWCLCGPKPLGILGERVREHGSKLEASGWYDSMLRALKRAGRPSRTGFCEQGRRGPVASRPESVRRRSRQHPPRKTRYPNMTQWVLSSKTICAVRVYWLVERSRTRGSS